MKIIRLLLLIFAFANPVLADLAFVHPGLLQNAEDLERMKRAVAAKDEPIFSGFELLRKHPQSQSNYVMRGPRKTVGRDRPGLGAAEYDSDANAAYQCALMWAITGERPYADKSKQIINAWSAKLKMIQGRDAVLMAGLGPFKMVNAAEILRYADAGWSAAEIKQAEKSFREVVYPVIADFAPFANGNWDAASMKTMMSIAVFCNDRAMFERALRYYVNGTGDGCITHYIINDNGQCEESGRDQQHTQLGLALLGDCCEIAWHQGIDLYGYDGNRLLKGFEYTAKYNLGADVPFVETLDCTGKYHHFLISTNGRGRFRAVYEQVYNHYVNRAGLSAPFVGRVVEKIRPEGPGLPGADHPGFGTLLYARSASAKEPTKTVPAPPSGFVAGGSSTTIKLSWITSVNASNYVVKRATNDGGPFTVVAENIVTNSFTDTQVESGKMYYYTVSAVNAVGESDGSMKISECAGLPEKWRQTDIGGPGIVGVTHFDGTSFVLETAGTGASATNDQIHLAYVSLEGDAVIVARFVPQTSSQFSTFGLTMREGLASDAAQVSLNVFPKPATSIEAPRWQAQLLVRDKNGTELAGRNRGIDLPEKCITYGRLTGACWLKLKRSGNSVTGFVSADGRNWTWAGFANVAMSQPSFAGLFGCSGLKGIPTRIVFDHVSVVPSALKF